MDEARRQLIATRTRDAIAERKRAGSYHRPPVLVDPSTVEIIVGLRRHGWSLRRIARCLDLEGRPTDATNEPDSKRRSVTPRQPHTPPEFVTTDVHR